MLWATKKKKKKNVSEGVGEGEAKAGNNEDRRPGLAGFLCEVQRADIPGGAVLRESRLKELTAVETRTLHPNPLHKPHLLLGLSWQMDKGNGEWGVLQR